MYHASMTAPPETSVAHDTGDEQVLVALEKALRMAAKRVFSVPVDSSRQIDRSGYVVLSILVDRGELRLSDVAAALELDASTVSRQVRRLDAAGLVTRRPDPADGRATLLAATAAGKTQSSMLQRLRVDRLEAALAGWSAADRGHLVRLTERLGSDLYAMGSAR
jgi:DNA-binding MarR family transcriptional regulator